MRSSCKSLTMAPLPVCSPVLEPEARWGDMWGMGWLNFHGKLVREVKRTDDRGGAYMHCSRTWRMCECSL